MAKETVEPLIAQTELAAASIVMTTGLTEAPPVAATV